MIQETTPTLGTDPHGSSNQEMRRGLGNLVAETTHTLTGTAARGVTGDDRGCPLVPEFVPQAMSAKWSKGTSGPAGDEVANLVPVAFGSKGFGLDAAGGISPTLRAGGHAESHPNGGVVPAVAFSVNQRDEGRLRREHGSLAASRSGKQIDGIVSGLAVRRLTPRECERLQGFPDDWTLVERANGKLAADGPRYKALGNSMAVPVMRWIGERIAVADAAACGNVNLP